MFEWIANLISWGGYLGLFFLTFIENVFPPIPSELIMPFGGYLAKEGKMSFWIAVAVGSLGATLGSLPLYYAGKVMGEQRLVVLADRYGHWLTVSGAEVVKAKDWFDRHRGMAVFGCRVLPGIRGFIALPAGMAHMPVPQFLVFTFAGCFVWTLILATAGFYLGESFASIDKFLGPISDICVGGLIVFGVWRLWKRKKRPLNKTRLPATVLEKEI
jgi:membrane protein DedA with SNARE-associated domain